jgi:hypothetical protein
MTYYAALKHPIYMPAVRDILSITQAPMALVTTTFDGINPGEHGYLTGLIVRMNIPPYFGMQNLNKVHFVITVVSPTTFTIPVNTLGFNPFVLPPADPRYETSAQVTPIGEEAAILTQSFVNILTPQFQE